MKTLQITMLAIMLATSFACSASTKAITPIISTEQKAEMMKTSCSEECEGMPDTPKRVIHYIETLIAVYEDAFLSSTKLYTDAYGDYPPEEGFLFCFYTKKSLPWTSNIYLPGAAMETDKAGKQWMILYHEGLGTPLYKVGLRKTAKGTMEAKAFLQNMSWSVHFKGAASSKKLLGFYEKALRFRKGI